jgi:hypothetical protein
MSEWMAPVFLNSALFFFECLYFAFPDPMEWWNSTGGLQEAWRDKLAASMHWCCTFGFPVPFFCAHISSSCSGIPGKRCASASIGRLQSLVGVVKSFFDVASDILWSQKRFSDTNQKKTIAKLF